jgi:glycosyltransferase involved in cell wall biosynthesis
MAEVVREGRDGLLAEPFSEKSLATQIQSLIASPENCAAMGSAGQQRILEEFHRKEWLQKINDVFLKVVPSA